LNLSELATLTGGTLHGPNAPVTGFATDSSGVHPGSVFLAIKGARVDGHDFVSAALERGASGTLAERPVLGSYILVPNLVDALAKMASTFRERFQGPVVGITGSAGKTTTKEFVAAALSPIGDILKTEGNRNTEYTAPLLWTELAPEHRAVVVEMSMRGFGQVAHLASFSEPTIGLVTNIGYSHLEMVGSRHGIAVAKAELLEALPDSGTAILWQSDDFLDFLKERAGARKVLTFGDVGSADCYISEYRPISWQESEVGGRCLGEFWSARLPAVGRHIALNAAAALLVASVAGVSVSEAASGLESSTLPPMRMQVVSYRGATVLLDTYNASPPSTIAAIETLAELPVEGQRLAVIGEMKELGDHAEDAHRQVGRALANHGLDRILFVGDLTKYCLEELDDPASAMLARSPDDVRKFLSSAQPGDAVLVKGSRALELEKALEGLA
jgi:UDP-N-acetylmuramoyl-tripeptide--D-alanyl-D-alanine ligase